MDLLLVRHGKTDWNVAQRVMGHRDVPINAEGLRQARHLHKWLKPIAIDAVYSSPMHRAMQTAEILVKGRGLKIILEPGVQEIDYGDWVGLTFAEVAEKYPKEYRGYRRHPSRVKIPGGERVRDVQKRSVAAIERMRKKHSGQRVLVISHADVCKAMLGHYLGIPLDLLQKLGCDNGSLSVYRFGTEWGDRLVALNYFADVQRILPW